MVITVSRIKAYRAIDERSIDINEATETWPRNTILSSPSNINIYPGSSKLIVSRLFMIAAVAPLADAHPDDAESTAVSVPSRPVKNLPQVRLVSATLPDLYAAQSSSAYDCLPVLPNHSTDNTEPVPVSAPA
jgi:hypothetical protein